jgi:amidophosphoribosyltransferase
MPQNQAMRDLVARMKLIPVRRLIEGKRIAVRRLHRARHPAQGKRAGSFRLRRREVHMRTACPTLIYPCEFLNFSSSRSTLDLVGRKVIRNWKEPRTRTLDQYARDDSAKNLAMIDKIRACCT